MTSLNPKFTFFVSIILIGLFLFGFVAYQKQEAEKAQLKLIEDEKLKVQELEQSIIVLSTPEPEPTGTPYQMYVPSPYKLGSSLKMNEWFNWKDNNASGYQQMNVSVTMYDYYTLKNFTYYDYNWGQLFNESAPDGFIYFMAFINIEMDDKITGKDTRMYLPQQTNFILFLNDYVYYPVVFDYEKNQILQMDNIYNLQHVERIKPYGYKYINKKDSVTGVKAPIMQAVFTLYGGHSNAEDGYIIYQIPENYNPRDIRLNGNFFSFGSASWRITD